MLRGLSLCGSHWVGTKSLTEGRNISQSHSNYSTPYERTHSREKVRVVQDRGEERGGGLNVEEGKFRLGEEDRGEGRREDVV